MMKKATRLRLLITAAIALLVSDGAQSCWQFNPGALKDYQDGVSQLVLSV